MKFTRYFLIALAFLIPSCNGSVQEIDKPSGSGEIMRSSSGSASANEGNPGDASGSISNEKTSEMIEKTEPVEEKRESGDVEKEVREEIENLVQELGNDFFAGAEGPFIVLGNIPENRFRQIMRYTIRACSEKMYKQFFDKKPEYKIKIYLFGDDISYRSTAKRLWNDTDLSPFGYYKPSQKTMVMNIATGTGTLVHEMFHALVDPDFPLIPSWFNEGIASLYECCQVKENMLKGMVNWRFPRLKEAVLKDELVPLKTLVFTSTSQFYGRDSDLHYAQARYFCMYMQEKGILEKFYKKFREGCEADPTGKTYLEDIFDKKIDEIEKDWIAWVKTLKYDR